MKTKGITIWERHAEKFVLGVALVLFIGFAALQFIGEPNAVSTPEGDVAPGAIDAMLEERANRIRSPWPAGWSLLRTCGRQGSPTLNRKDSGRG